MVKTLPSNAGGVGSIPGQRAKIPHASGPEKRKENRKQQKQYCNKFNKDFKKNFCQAIGREKDLSTRAEAKIHRRQRTW